MLLASAEPGDGEQAADSVREALATARELSPESAIGGGWVPIPNGA